MRLAGKVALITGAAAGLQGEVMGFGGATSWLFAREGAKVVLTDVDEDTGQKTASQIRQGGWEALFVRLDVTSEQDWTDAVSTTIAKYGRLDILFNNAGGGPGHALEETPVEDWDRVMDLNAKGVFLGAKHAVPEMRKVGGGSIINMSSVHGIAGTPRSVAYSAAKGAIRNFTKAAALGYAKEGIRVNSIHPGNSLTARVAKLYPDGNVPERMWSNTPMKRLGTADEIAHAVLYLASAESSFTTGAELVVDGGFLAV
jgi:NAD(P)-dependent dehydrogenase (short-subunit alcohol dehydrogenase family)